MFAGVHAPLTTGVGSVMVLVCQTVEITAESEETLALVPFELDHANSLTDCGGRADCDYAHCRSHLSVQQSISKVRIPAVRGNENLP